MSWLVKAIAKVGDGFNGLKTVAGLAITAGGVALFWTPAAPVAKEIVTAGLTITGVGIINKAQKSKQKKNNDGGKN